MKNKKNMWSIYSFFQWHSWATIDQLGFPVRLDISVTLQIITRGELLTQKHLEERRACVIPYGNWPPWLFILGR